MIARNHARIEPTVLKFPSIIKPPVDPDWPFEEGEKITLRRWYDAMLLPEIERIQSKRSLAEDRVALNRWEELTGNPDIREATRAHLEQLRDGLQARGCTDHTSNKVWRELKAIFRDAVDCEVIGNIPSISRKRTAGLVKASRVKQQRESLTLDQVDRLYLECRRANYPTRQQFPAAKMWRVAVVLLFTYGARTLDVFSLEWANVRWSDRLIQFQAMKTSKVQGLPMTDIVAAHLRSIQGRSARVFPGLKSTGHFNGKTNRWKAGFYTTWRRDIAPAASLPDVTFKHFRESMVTRYNGIEPNLGSWIAGHFVPGVSAQFYDLPTARIREAIESAPVPDSFRQLD